MDDTYIEVFHLRTEKSVSRVLVFKLLVQFLKEVM